jgi:thioredoxin 1
VAKLTAITDDSFDEEVLRAEVPIIVDFWASWCRPCKWMEPYLESVAEQMGDRVKVVKVDADENPDTVARFRVRALPTVIVLKNGSEVERIRGARTKKRLLAAVKKSHLWTEETGYSAEVRKREKRD